MALQQDDPLLRDNDNYGNFRSPGFRRALHFYRTIYEQEWAPKVSETQVSNVWYEFFNGNYAFYFSGPWNVREFKLRQPPNMSGQWGTMALPGPNGLDCWYCWWLQFGDFKSSQSKQAAWRLVEYLSRPQVQARFHSIIGDLRAAALVLGIFLVWLKIRWRVLLQSSWSGSKPHPRCWSGERIVQEMRLITEQVVRGGLSEQQAVEQL